MNKPNQKIYHCKVQSLRNQDSEALSDINGILASGFEINDIVPIMEKSGGAIFTRGAGIYPVTWIFILTETGRKTHLRFHSLSREEDFLEKLEKFVSDENALGYRLFKTIPYFYILDPESGHGIGRGTGGLASFFVADIANQ